MPRTSKELLNRALGTHSRKVVNKLKSGNDGSADLSEDNSNSNEQTPELRHWRDLSTYLESLQKVDGEDLKMKERDVLDNSSLLHGFGSDPLQQPVSYRICNGCGIALLDVNIVEHLKECGKDMGKKKGNAMVKKKDEVKKEVEVIESEDLENNVSKSVNASPKKNQKKVAKRKNEVVKEKEEVKKAKVDKKKSEPKVVKPKQKPKGPVDVERQCGVPLPNGGFCARSLTCKTHSMGAKRAVLGRSAPYDQLLAAYQRKNQAKIGAAAAAAQQAKDDLMHGAGVAIDDEEETRQVLAGVRESLPAPIERNVCIPARMRTGYLRMREMFASNMLPRLQNNPLGKMYARAAVMNVENIDESSHFPVRSQHQKNNQQRQMQAQIQKHQMQKQMQMQGRGINMPPNGNIHDPSNVNMNHQQQQQLQQGQMMSTGQSINSAVNKN